jgi:hypothetical protein
VDETKGRREPSDEELALGVTWRCQEHGVQVKACAHAVTACYLEAPKERFEFPC